MIIAGTLIVAGIIYLASSVLNQPEVQEGLSTMINKASYAVKEFAENAASVIASAAISVASAVSEVTGISSAPVLAPPTGLKKKFSTITDSNANPYLAPWLGSMSIAETYARSKAISDATTTVATVNATGTLVAIRDGINHVSIIPNPLVGTLERLKKFNPLLQKIQQELF